ncbi:MAG: VWA domain-containing protein [Pseudomonadota bacterium]
MTPFPALRLLLTTLILTLAAPVAAQSTKSILVLDASNSMWGQIEGEAKITIARRVIGDLLDTFPSDQALGLSAYGHNREGDCTDIEQLVPPTEGTADAIRAAIEGITPRGKTPLSAAVIAAAKELGSEDAPATVILISDGIETCNLDPCEVGAELERTSVDFTAHVIGFDVASPEERAQLACLAENTGGQFLGASNATELATALAVVAEPAPPPPPSRVDLEITVLDGEGGSEIQRGLVWTLAPEDPEGTSLDGFEMGALRMSVRPGAYAVDVAWPAEENAVGAEIDVVEGDENQFTLIMPSNTPPASVATVDQAVAGTFVAVEWDGPDADLDYVSIAEPETDGNGSINRVRTSEGSPLRIQMPAEPGDYEVRYVLYDGREILAAQTIRVIEGDVAVEASSEAEAGTSIVVAWRGPDAPLDYVSVAEIGSAGGDAINRTRTQDGSPLRLQMPADPGTYELRYVLYNGRAILAAAPIEVVATEVSVSGPSEAEAGTYITVQWVGPDEALDYISVAVPGTPGGDVINRVRTNEGQTIELQMPAEPGSYELRYVLYNERAVLAAVPIEVTEPQVSVSGPAEAEAGTSVLIEWAGPEADLDYVSIAEIGSQGGASINTVRVQDGNPLSIQMPAEAGTYELRYILYNGRSILAAQPITVTPSTATVAAPSEASAGTFVAVDWTGPEADLDYVDIAPLGTPGHQAENRVRVSEGQPLQLQMPASPGDYEVRYILYNGREILARTPLTVLPPDVTLSAPASVAAGAPMIVEWTGPNANLDFISIAVAGDAGNQYAARARTNEGSPLAIEAPDAPGEYELRYVLYNGREVLARQTLIVE